MPDRLVGILGGLGPAAGAEFYRLLIEHTPASRDQEHLPVAMWADPAVPERLPALRGDGESVVPALTRGVRRLADLGADLIACPCNTVHVWLPEIAAQRGVELVSIIEATAAECEQVIVADEAVAILATTGTIDSGLYQRALAARGISWMLPSSRDQARMTEIIGLVKTGGPQALDHAAHALAELCGDLAAQGAGVILGGCTELGVVAPPQAGIRLVDSLTSLAIATVRSAYLPVEAGPRPDEVTSSW